jgi:hypothetical protein
MGRLVNVEGVLRFKDKGVLGFEDLARPTAIVQGMLGFEDSAPTYGKRSG